MWHEHRYQLPFSTLSDSLSKLQTKATCKHTHRIHMQQQLLKYFPASIIGKENCHKALQKWNQTRCFELSRQICLSAAHLGSQPPSLFNANINFTTPNLVILLCKSPWRRLLWFRACMWSTFTGCPCSQMQTAPKCTFTPHMALVACGGAFVLSYIHILMIEKQGPK